MGRYMPRQHFTHLQFFPLASPRQSAGGGFISSFCSKVSVGRSLATLHPSQLGEGDPLDEDVATEARRIQQGAGDGDVVKVTGHGVNYMTVKAP